MKRLSLALVLVLCAASALAQKLDSFDFHVANVVILQDRRVQSELGITAAQRAKMNVYASKHRERIKSYEQELQAKKEKADPKKVLGFLETLKEGVLKQLSASQLKRLRELTLQNVGLAAVADEVVAKRVGLSASQLSKFRSILTTANKKIFETERSAAKKALAKYEGMHAKTKDEAQKLASQAKADLQAAGRKIAPTLQKLTADRNEKMAAVLTSKQQKAFVALQGKPFVPKS